MPNSLRRERSANGEPLPFVKRVHYIPAEGAVPHNLLWRPRSLKSTLAAVRKLMCKFGHMPRKLVQEYNTERLTPGDRFARAVQCKRCRRFALVVLAHNGEVRPEGATLDITCAEALKL